MLDKIWTFGKEADQNKFHNDALVLKGPASAISLTFHICLQAGVKALLENALPRNSVGTEKRASAAARV